MRDVVVLRPRRLNGDGGIRWFLAAYVVVGHVLLPLTESRKCKQIRSLKRCEMNCCGVRHVAKCQPSCQGTRCFRNYHCDGGCCGVNGRCRNCSVTPVPKPFRPTGKCQYDGDCCFKCPCLDGKCYKVPSRRPQGLWETTPKQEYGASSARRITLLKAIFIFLGCTICVVIFGISLCRRQRRSRRRIPQPNFPGTVSQLNAAPNHDPSWTEIAVPNHNYTNEMSVRPSIISHHLPPPYTLNPDVMMPPPSYEAAVANDGYTGNI